MRNIENVTAFEREHFNPASIIVRPHAIDIPAQMAGLTLTTNQIVGLSGAPSGSTVTLGFRARTAREGSETVPAGLYFDIENDRYIQSHNTIGVFRDSAAGYGIYIKLIDFKPGGPKGLAARMLALIVRAAFDLGNVRRLRLLAAGGRSWDARSAITGERWGGFVAWPTYGFDMELLPTTLKIAKEFPYYPEGLRSLRTVREVLQVSGGREYWKVVGDGLYMDFDLTTKTTASILTLDSFLGRAQI